MSGNMETKHAIAMFEVKLHGWNLGPVMLCNV